MNPREKALRTNRIISIIEIAIGAVLLGIVAIFGLKMSEVVVVLIGFVGVTLFIAGILWGTMIKAQVKRCYCKNCGEKYNYQNDISWEVTDQIETDKDVTDVVDFTCVCAHCGEVLHFTKKFKIAFYDNKGNLHKRDIRVLASNFFKGYSMEK